MADRMKAFRFHEYGDADKLVLDTVPRPEPKANEVLVRIHAASINPIDWKLRQGFMKDFMPLALPYTPGSDAAGTVEAVGTGVTSLKAGDAVFARTELGGGYAEYVALPADAVGHKPASFDFVQAASVPVVALTAWAGIFEFGGLSAGQTILIHGAAGGVGIFAVQFAKYKGARVLATASGEDLEFVKSLGADEVVDYHTQRFEEVFHDVDVVLESIGGETQERSWGVLKRGGILVATNAPPSPEKAAEHGVRIAMVQVTSGATLLNEISALLESGTVKTEVGRVFPFTEARQAQELSQHGHVRGKIVLQML